MLDKREISELSSSGLGDATNGKINKGKKMEGSTERLEKAGIKFDPAKDLATVDLDTLRKAMDESPVLRDEVQRLYKSGVKTNFANLYNTLLNNEELFPSFGFNKKQLLYEAFMDFMKEHVLVGEK